MKSYVCETTTDIVTSKSHDDIVNVLYGPGYYEHLQGMVACSVRNTGKFLHIQFPPVEEPGATLNVFLDIVQARLLVLALAKFKKELGFSE